MNFTLRMFALMAVPLAVASCSFEPFVDEQMTGSMRIAQITPGFENRFAICYNTDYTTPQAVTALARDECSRRGFGKVVVLRGQTLWQCRLLVPARAYFKCMSPPESPDE